MNNNQYSSLPHTQNAGVGTQQRNAYGNNNGNSQQPNRPYNKKKHYNKNKSNNYNKPNQPFNNYNNNHTDFGCTSLPHTQTHNNYNNTRYSVPYHQFNKFSNENASPDLESFGNNVPVPKLNKNHNHHKNNKKARGGSNNNYRANGHNMNNDNRLNKSLNKDGSLDNSFSDIASPGMPTSLSLDNIGAYNSYNNNTNSPSKVISALLNKLTKADTILEQELTTSTSAYVDSGVDSNSYSSMPITDYQKNSSYPPDAQLLSSIECNIEEEADEKEKTSTTSSSISSSSSPGSPNTNGYQTAISQMASEAEISFGYDSMNTVNVENTINNFNIEAEFFGEIENFIGLKKQEAENGVKEEEEEKKENKLVKEVASVETNAVGDDTATSIVSDSSDTGSIKEVELAVQEEVEEGEIIDIVEETQKDATVLTSPIPEIVVSMAMDEEEIELDQPDNLIDNSKTKMPNLISKENIQKELESFDKTDLTAKQAEVEVNNLINTIVGDVITSVMHIEEEKVPEEVSEEKVQPFETNYMSLEQEISQLEEKEKEKANEEEGEISFIDNDNSVLYGKSDTSAVVIEQAEESRAETTNDILNKAEKVLSGSSSSLKVTDSKGKVVVKEPPVDCFSCTIS